MEDLNIINQPDLKDIEHGTKELQNRQSPNYASLNMKYIVCSLTLIFKLEIHN